jgi:hypothetical protein
MNRIPFLLVPLAACSSIVSDPCAHGYEFVDGHCIVRDRPDAGIGGELDGGDGGGDGGGGGDSGTGDGGTVNPPDGATCSADTTSDPDNCGTCGHVCASGICTDSHCIGELPGHVVAIGHDYTTHHSMMARVLANSVGLALPRDVAVAEWRGTATLSASGRVMASLGEGMTNINRPWHKVALPTAPGTGFAGADVLVVDPQVGDGDTVAAEAAAYAGDVAKLLERNGVVVVLEGAGGTSFRFADAAGLYTMAAPGDATGQPASVVDSSDAVAWHVLSPYMADSSSVAFPAGFGPVVFATSAGPLVVHFTRF